MKLSTPGANKTSDSWDTPKPVKVLFSSLVRGLVLAGEIWIPPRRFC